MSYTAEDFARDSNVSRETLDDLITYADLLKKWTVRINLVSKSSLDDIWRRHIQDSLQIADLVADPPKKWVDIGSGGGFPGLVIAIAQKTSWLDTQFTLIESDQRKAAFLRTVISETGARADVLSKRIEDVPYLNADILSARALASLSDLFEYGERHLSKNGQMLFLKGSKASQEISEAERNWRFKYALFDSKTDSTGVILRIGELARA